MKESYYDSWAVAQANGTDIAYRGQHRRQHPQRAHRLHLLLARAPANLALKSSQVFDTRDSNGVTPSDHRPLMSIFTVK